MKVKTEALFILCPFSTHLLETSSEIFRETFFFDKKSEFLLTHFCPVTLGFECSKNLKLIIRLVVINIY